MARGGRPAKGTSQPRLLLKRLHSVMGSEGDAHDKLGRIVRLVAQNMVAEVCSVYLLRAGGVLELFATEGLKPEAVHQTRLTIGEGLVGLVAERGLPVNLSEATQHPRFAYRPETGEDLYHSFLGVPVMRLGRVSGVLTIQNVTPRTYTDEEIEALQTIAMVLAELSHSLELVSQDEIREEKVDPNVSVTLDGVKLVDGVASGIVAFHRPPVKVTRVIADDESAELDLLETSIKQVSEDLEDMLSRPDLSGSGDHREVLEAYRVFIFDQGWHQKMRDAVASGLTAEASVDRVRQETRRRMLSIPDPYLRERASDLDELAQRLIRKIQGSENDGKPDFTEDTILVARDMGPAELLDYQSDLIKGVALEEGSTTGHMGIIARAMGIPVLGRVKDLLSHVEAGDALVLDTDQGHLFLRPDDDVIAAYKASLSEAETRAAGFAAEVALASVTRDNVPITLMMNAGMTADLASLERTGAEGIGLFRTEFQFMVSRTLPRVEEQTRIYSTALDAAGDQPVVFRTLDVGGDKHVPFLPRDEEENPAMGWRAIRVALDRPALLRFQLRALLIAASGRTLHVMFPMIAEVAELRKCRAILDLELERLKRHNRALPERVYVGCMLEIPALVWQMDSLLKEIDFLSIGTNDLMQFFFACDRSSPRLSGRYDLLAPSVLSFLKDIVDKCDAADVPVTLCGEMGAHPLEALALIGLGMRRLSVSPGAIGPVKHMVRTTNLSQLRPFIESRLGSSDHSIRESLKNFARDHAIDV